MAKSKSMMRPTRLTATASTASDKKKNERAGQESWKEREYVLANYERFNVMPSSCGGLQRNSEGDLALCRQLVRAGVPVNGQGRQRRTALH